MQFSVSDKVIHPKYGAGRVVGVEHQELIEGFEHYYVIKIIDQKLTVRVPMRKTEDLGIRPVMSRDKMSRVLNMLRSMPNELPKNFKKRQAEVREKLRTGRPLQVAEALRDLFWRGELAHLTKADIDLLARARSLLATEMALVTDGGIFEANTRIDAALEAAAAREPQMPA